MLIPLVVTALVAASMALPRGFLPRASAVVFLLRPAVPYLVLSVVAVSADAPRRHPRREALAARGRFDVRRRGDGDALFRRHRWRGDVLAPQGSVREGWIMRIYLQIGDPETLQRRVSA